MDHYFDRPTTTRAEEDEEEEELKWMVVGGGDWILIRLKWKWLVIIILCTCPRRLILRRFQRPRVSLCGDGSHPPSASHRPCDVWLTVCETITTWRWNVVVVVGRGGTGRERIFNVSALKHFAQELYKLVSVISNGWWRWRLVSDKSSSLLVLCYYYPPPLLSIVALQ